MSLWSRIKRGVGAFIREVTQAPPQAPPSPPAPYVSEEVVTPTDTGYWHTREQIWSEEEATPWRPGIGDDTDARGYAADYYMGNEITLSGGDYGEPYSNTWDEWRSEIMQPKEYLIEKYNLDNIDIIRQLEGQGYWTDLDWYEWAVEYETIYG